MTSSKTNIGGALTALGGTLLGIGVVPQLAGVSSQLLMYTAITGFFMSALGGALTGFFARDNDKTSVDVGLQKVVNSPTGPVVNPDGPQSEKEILKHK